MRRLMNTKILLLSISVLVIGIFAMPGTLSMFAGQHAYINGSSVDCKKCHMDVYDEMTSYKGDPPAPHSSGLLLQCKVCHRTGDLGLIWGAPQIGISGNAETNLSAAGAHSAVTVECVFCHDMIVNEINGTREAHSIYYNEANRTSLLKGGNEACIGCHTHTIIDINWKRPGGYNVTFNWSADSFDKWSLNATTVTNTTKKT